jgi:hypothetical protein
MTEIDVNNMDSDAQREYYIRMCTELQEESKELETAKLQKCSFCELFDYMVLLEARIKALKGLPLTELTRLALILIIKNGTEFGEGS